MTSSRPTAWNLRVEFSASIELLAESAERTLFVETFGKSDTVTEDDLRRHFEPSLRSAAAGLAGDATAETLIDAANHSRWIDALRPAAEAVAFACGLRVSSPMQALVTSDEFDRRRRSEANRAQTERDAEGRLATAKHTAAMLREWQFDARRVPDIVAGRDC